MPVDARHDLAQARPRIPCLRLGQRETVDPLEGHDRLVAAAEPDLLHDLAVAAGNRLGRDDSGRPERIHPGDLGADRRERVVARSREAQSEGALTVAHPEGRVLAVAHEADPSGAWNVVPLERGARELAEL